MYYTVYKTTNRVTGKVYVGCHKTQDLNDGYLGSGKYLKYSIKKHGIDKFDKEILFVFDNAEQMYQKEAEIVDTEFVAERNTYNLKLGGFGGWDHINNDVDSRIKKNKKAMEISKDKLIAISKQKRQQRIVEYEKTPKRCKNCNKPIEYDKRVNKFCGSSCAAKFNNKGVNRHYKKQMRVD